MHAGWRFHVAHPIGPWHGSILIDGDLAKSDSAFPGASLKDAKCVVSSGTKPPFHRHLAFCLRFFGTPEFDVAFGLSRQMVAVGRSTEMLLAWDQVPREGSRECLKSQAGLTHRGRLPSRRDCSFDQIVTC